MEKMEKIIPLPFRTFSLHFGVVGILIDDQAPNHPSGEVTPNPSSVV